MTAESPLSSCNNGSDSHKTLHNQLYQNSTKYWLTVHDSAAKSGKCAIPYHKGSSRMNPSPAHSTFAHHHIPADLQDTQHHWRTLYPHPSQPLHSTTWNVNPCYKFLLTHHICSLRDNSAPCLNSRQPATAVKPTVSNITLNRTHRSQCWTSKLIPYGQLNVTGTILL